MQEEKVIVAFSGNFGQLDLLTLAKTGLSTAGKLLSDNRVVNSMISQVSQTITAAQLPSLPAATFVGKFVAPGWLILFVTSWIFDALGDRWGPVDNPIYVNIYNSGVERANNLKLWGLTDREIHDLAFKIGFIPMISLTGRIIRVPGGYIGSRPTQMFPETYSSKDGSVEIVDPDSWIVTGIYAPAEKKYMDQNVWMFQGFGPEGLWVEGEEPYFIPSYADLPWGIASTNIGDPIPQSVIDKINNAAKTEASGAQITPEGISTPSGLVITNEALSQALQAQPQQAGMTTIAVVALAGLALPLLFNKRKGV